MNLELPQQTRFSQELTEAPALLMNICLINVICVESFDTGFYQELDSKIVEE